MRQLFQRVCLVTALALFVGAGVGCEKKSKTVVVEDESGRFEKIGEGIDKTKEAAETTVDEAEKTVDTISDDN